MRGSQKKGGENKLMLLAITIWIFTLITVLLFTDLVPEMLELASGEWFPEAASAHAAIVDTQFFNLSLIHI